MNEMEWSGMKDKCVAHTFMNGWMEGWMDNALHGATRIEPNLDLLTQYLPTGIFEQHGKGRKGRRYWMDG